MKKIPLFFFLIFSGMMCAQSKLDIRNYYLNELVSQKAVSEITTLNDEPSDWREDAVSKITSFEFMDPSYLKMTMVLNMLNYKLGDEVYLKSIKEYAFNHEGSLENSTLDDFKTILETHSQRDLTEFFNDWIKGKGYPSYEVNWYQNKANVIHIIVSQTQSDPSVSFFEMPLPIKVIANDGTSQIIRLEISEDKQSFDGYIPFRIEEVIIDPDYQLISRNNTVKLGVDQDLLNQEISLYPNPAKNFLKVYNNSDAIVEKVSIYNMLGKLVLEETNPMASIDLKPVGFGIHLVKIQTNQGTLHKTFLKEQ
ncbi:T9SS type A sorting domain-containing protein [Flavobacteriaceae bacterium F08102]|nr:T9SS type A sorting domain-containing protein [Flavobacteriaceae bacterium F08102]